MIPKIVAIIGSTKPSKSSSAAVVEHLAYSLGTAIPAYRAAELSKAPDALLNEILRADVVLVAFPLYWNCLPAALLEALIRLEAVAAKAITPLPKVYAVCNSGVWEAEDNATALRVVRNFCARSGLTWRYGVGIGGGALIGGDRRSIKKHGPTKKLHAALAVLGADILMGGSQASKDVLVRPGIPRFLYCWVGNAVLLSMAWKNGALRKLGAKPYEEA